MTEYCTVSFTSWKPDSDPNQVVEYVFDHAQAADHKRLCMKDLLSSLGSPRLQVTRQHDDTSEEGEHCVLVLQCKPVYSLAIVGLAVASEARTLEVYDARDSSYLQTVRGQKDREDSEADDSIVHFMCRCTLDEPLHAVSIKFLSLGQRKSFEIAHLRVMLETSSKPSVGSTAMSGQTIDMERLRRDVDSMGDTVSDRAKAFLTTLEHFQKNKQGAVDDMRHLLLDKNQPGAEGQSMAGITALLSMFAASPAVQPSSSPQGATSEPTTTTTTTTTTTQAEGFMVSSMLSQMMSSLAREQEAASRGGEGDMFQFLQSVCSQVSRLRAAEELETGGHSGGDRGVEKDRAGAESVDGSAVAASAELESRVTAQVEAIVESRLNAVEEHIKEQVDQRMEEMETRMSGKLDAIFALLQNSQKPS